MTLKRAFVKVYSTPIPMSGWRGSVWLLVGAAIFIALPEARALVIAGLLGGVVIAGVLIYIRRGRGASGPGRGTPIVLFRPEPVATRDFATLTRRTRGAFAPASFG